MAIGILVAQLKRATDLVGTHAATLIGLYMAVNEQRIGLAEGNGA